MKVSWGDYSQYMEITIKSSLNYHLFIIKSSLHPINIRRFPEFQGMAVSDVRVPHPSQVG
jgi:hypothetical protein